MPTRTDPPSAAAPLPADEAGVERDPLGTDMGWGRWLWTVRILVGLALLLGFVLRFVARSPLWLDEALSVNIARLPIGSITGALKLDGHPPLYYVLLHAWLSLFGDGPVAVRAFSGVWSLALFPVVWVAARRLGGHKVAVFAVALLALSPFAIRYGTETRMYAMVSVLALVGWLLVDDALRKPTRGRLAAIAVVVGLLLWTHYWAMWLLVAGGIALVVHGLRARRDGRADDQSATVSVLAAFVIGGLAFLPWLPTLLYQTAHTGTPWARPVRPTEMIVFTLSDFGGGPKPEAVLLGWFFGLALVLGVFGRATGRFLVELDVRSRPEARPFAILIAGTLAVASAVGYATGATYTTRYAAVFFPFALLLVALGLDRLKSRPVVVSSLACLLLLGGIGGVRNAVTDRSDARRSVAAIEANGSRGDVVVYCPDQLGPSGSRLLAAGFDQVTYPDFGQPQQVDWVDYKERLARSDPQAFADRLLARAGDHRIFLVSSPTYITHRKVCPALQNAIGSRRAAKLLTSSTDAYEPAQVLLFYPPKQ